MDYGDEVNVWARARVQIRRYMLAIRRVWWLLPLTSVAGMCVAAWATTRMPPAFQSTAEMVYNGQYQFSGSAVYSDQLANYFDTQMQLMQSSLVQDQAKAQVQTLHPDWKAEPADFKAVQAKDAAIVQLKVTARTKEYAQAYLNACMQAYLDEKRQMLDTHAAGATAGLSREMDQLNTTMDQYEAQMLAFQKANNVGFLEEEGNSAAKYLDELQRQLSTLKSNYDLSSMLSLDQSLDRAQGARPDATASPGAEAQSDISLTNYGPIADYQKARQVIALLRAKLSDMSHRLKPKHPDIIALNQQIQQEQDLMDTLRSQSEDAFKTHREDLKVQIQNLENEVNDQQAKALVLSGKLAEYNQIKTKADRAKQEYEQLLTNSQSVDVSRNVVQEPLSIYQEASPAFSVKPGELEMLGAGLAGGLFIGLLVLFVVEQTDDRISSLMELQAHFPETLLGQIPAAKMDGDNALLRVDDDRQALLESFRTLRSSLIFLPVEGKRPKTFVVTSALPDEGKTTVSSNLAVTLAFSGGRTLIVDADLRRGQVTRVFGAQGCNGFSDVLLKKKPWRECVYTTSTENLFIMPCGPALQQTSEHLLGRVTDKFLVDIYDQFDYVVFDSPPTVILDDTLCLAPKIDATLFVLRFNNSSVRPCRHALELLESRQANVIGIVVNGVTASETKYNYNYNYRQYGNRYAEARVDRDEHANGRDLNGHSKPVTRAFE